MNNLTILHKWLAIIFMALFGWLTYCLLTGYTDHTVARIVIVGKFPPQSLFEARLTSPTGFTKKVTVKIPENVSQKSVRFGTPRLNFATREVDLVFKVFSGATETQYMNIHSIHFELPYTHDLFIGQKRLSQWFSSEQFRGGDGVSIPAVDKKSNSVTLKLRQPLVKKSPLPALLLSMLFGLAVFLLLTNLKWRLIPAISDLELGNKISSREEFDTVNGLRGLAAIMVLLSHTAPGFISNRIGIALLFLFSGFLLSKPFIMQPDRIFSWSVIKSYLTKRLKRILPVYYLYVFVIYVVPFELDIALRHFMFVEARGHLWPMSQIFTFYMLLPVVLLLCCGLYKLHPLLPPLVLLAAIVGWLDMVPRSWTPYYTGAHSYTFHLYAFLMGVLGSYLQYDRAPYWQMVRNWIQRQRKIMAPVALLILLLTIAWSAPVAPPKFLAAVMNQFYFRCILSLIIILLTLNLNASWFSAALSNWLFRSVGVVGFSFYIWHGFGMQIVQSLQVQMFGFEQPWERSWEFFISTFIVTYLLAVISYSWVERPFFGYRNENN